MAHQSSGTSLHVKGLAVRRDFVFIIEHLSITTLTLFAENNISLFVSQRLKIATLFHQCSMFINNRGQTCMLKDLQSEERFFIFIIEYEQHLSTASLMLLAAINNSLFVLRRRCYMNTTQTHVHFSKICLMKQIIYAHELDAKSSVSFSSLFSIDCLIIFPTGKCVPENHQLRLRCFFCKIP